MSAAPQHAVGNTQQVKALQVFIGGKVESFRRVTDGFFTMIMCPAQDQFSRPQVVEVRSKQLIGRKDEMVKLVANIGGYNTRGKIPVTDRDTGESRVPVFNHITLDAVE